MGDALAQFFFALAPGGIGPLAFGGIGALTLCFGELPALLSYSPALSFDLRRVMVPKDAEAERPSRQDRREDKGAE